ncbi:MAG: DegV family protein [Anaerolineaceae bacterium]|jgi:DegV family protein with EDD domain|nr:DegV family protein [Anaerolineaceae bacterium]MDD4043797.1 DegV family protein [Anaerolineaceae bacterium]
MKIVTDSGADISFTDCQKIGVTMVPLKVEVNGVSYQAGIDIEPEKFYDMMDASPTMPITSTPSIGDFSKVYEQLAEEDDEILSIHISSGLSATYNVAKQAAETLDKTRIHLFDTLTLSAGQAWFVNAAAKMRDAGKSMDEVLAKLTQMQNAVSTHFTLPDLKYLIAGGRISHLRGLLASLLGIKPVIEVSKEDGKYYDRVKKRSFQKAILGITELLETLHPQGSTLVAQICTAANPEGGAILKEAMDRLYKVNWLPEVTLGTALGAHTGRGLVGIISAREDALPEIP